MNRINTFISPSNANQFIILWKTEIENVLINNISVATLVTEEKKIFDSSRQRTFRVNMESLNILKSLEIEHKYKQRNHDILKRFLRECLL